MVDEPEHRDDTCLDEENMWECQLNKPRRESIATQLVEESVPLLRILHALFRCIADLNTF